MAIDASDAPLRPASEPPAAGTAGFIAAGLVIKPIPAHACGIVDEVTVAETACGMIVWWSSGGAGVKSFGRATRRLRSSSCGVVGGAAVSREGWWRGGGAEAQVWWWWWCWVVVALACIPSRTSAFDAS